MKSENIKNKDGQVMTTKEGKELVKNTLEIGDEFIPKTNGILSTKREVEVKGKVTTITDNKIVATVKDKDGNLFEEVFISLTPSQARTIQKKLDSDIEINQSEWVVYEYESKEYGAGQIGVGIKKERKEPIKFAEQQEKEE